MNKQFAFIIAVFIFTKTEAQELYVYSEPASNMPARSVIAKLTGRFVTNDNIYGRFTNRYTPEIQFGVSKKFMVHTGISLANMHTNEFKYESFFVYAKYRFLSKDELHKHFRMAVFAQGSSTKAPFHYDEITLMGDKSGIEAGLIATQLWHKLAVSATVSHTQLLDNSRFNKVLYLPERNYQAMNYSLSAGYLLLPKEYTDYKQTNLNLYVELLGQQTLDRNTYYWDIAPALQLIFNSNAKLNIGRRMQVATTMDRMARNSWLVSFERTFLNALPKKKK